MPFTQEPNYFNRYRRDQRYVEWRNLAGEVQQAAEVNETQALAKDLIQRLGDATLQNGDVVEGMYASYVRDGSDAALGSVKFYEADSGKIWIDGIVHEIEGSITDLPVPDSGWGFVGVYLRKELITSQTAVEGPLLRDPAIHDANGNPLGLPGANRLKVTPIWVAGSLPTSPFDEKQVSSLVAIHNSLQTLVPIDPVLDTSVSVSPNCIFNAKIRFPGTTTNGVFTPANLTDLSQILVRMKEDAKPIEASSQITLKARVQVEGLADGVTLQASVNLFGPLGAVLTVPGNKVKTLTNGVPQDLDLPITSDMVSSLGDKVNLYHLGVKFETTSGVFNPAVQIYLSDLRAERASDQPRPPYKQFVMEDGPEYWSFVVGMDRYIRHGKVSFTRSESQTHSQPQTIDGALVSELPKPSYKDANGNTVPVEDLIVRRREITREMADTFLDTYGTELEDGLIRVYPVHLFYNGVVVSSLNNREFSRLTENYLTDQLGAVVHTTTITGLDLLAVSDGNNGYVANQIDIGKGAAFVNGRRFAVDQPPRVVLPTSVGSVLPLNPPEPPIDYDKTTTFYPLSGRFVELKHVEVEVLFKETVTHIQTTGAGNVLQRDPNKSDYIALVGLDVLSVSAAEILKVQTNTYTFKKGLDWDVVRREDGSGNPVTAVGWLNIAPANGKPGSYNPDPGQTFTVYYSARIKLAVPATGQTESTQLKYVKNNNYNVGFQLKSSDYKGIDGVSMQQLAGFAHAKLGTTLFGPALVSGNFLVGRTSNTEVSPTFHSRVYVYGYTVADHNSYIIYFSGNVQEDGPDGAFAFESVKDDLDSQEDAKKRLLLQNKLPLGIVKMPASPSNITQYDLRQITLAEQHAANQAIQDVVKILPVMLSQMLVGGDFSLPEARLYESAHANYAEAKRLDLVTWKIDSDTFPALDGYTVACEYDYYADNTLMGNPQVDVSGLLQQITATIKDASLTVVKTIRTTFRYNSDFDINDTQVEVL